MLSTENPPPDPSCACQFPHLNSSTDERGASHKQNQQQQQLPLPEVVDLPNPSVDDQPTPLPNFSIRDYVFTARSKDIKKNWPFSPKILKLCLKHGVKDVLPPFQPLDTVRNQSVKRCLVETSSSQKKSDHRKELSSADNHVLLDSSTDTQLNNKLAESCIDISSCRSGEENDFPSTTTSLSQSEIESVGYSRQPNSRSETKSSFKAPVEVLEVAVPSVIHKTETTARPVGKKCKLIVKFGGQSDRSSPEDIASNCSVISETMTSKVCPVCKTFSSSSNTTLNAHIDQCLSVESTPKWTADTKLTRYRIKPRKTRLMVDIYETAQHCTLEELDRRNGTNWAKVSRLPAQEIEMIETSKEGKKLKISPVQPEDDGDVGPVYIDSSGTKVRILSKFNDSPPVSKEGQDIPARKTLKGCKSSKYISKKKKQRLAQKHQKHLNHASQSKTFFSHNHGSQMCGSRAEEYDGEGRSSEKQPQIPKQIRTSDAGTLRPWICSKRRAFTKKTTRQEGQQLGKRKWHASQNLICENDQSFLVNSLAESMHDQESMNLVSNHERNERVEMPFHGDQLSDRKDCSPRRKSVGSLLLGSRIVTDVEKSCPPKKQNVKQLTKDNTSSRDNCMLKHQNPTRNHVPSLRKKVVDAQKKISASAGAKSSRSSRAIVTKAMRFSNFRRNMLSVSSRSSAAEYRPSSLKNWSTFRKSQVHSVRERDDEVVAWRSKANQQYALMNSHAGSQFERERVTDQVSLSRSTILETGKETRLSCTSLREEALALRSLKSRSHCSDHGERVNGDSSVIVTDFDCLESTAEQVQVHEDVVTRPYSSVFPGRSATSLSQSVDTEFYKMNSSSRAQSNSFRSVEDYGLLYGTEAPADPTEPNSSSDQEMFSVHEAGNGVLRQNLEMEMDSEGGQGNIFPEVDPIPIPGPPGSFLPSPRDMGSEDFQGTSSLTSSRVQSSPDQHEVVDGESSDSPISAASTISNPTAGRPHFKYSAGSSAIGEKIRSGFVVTSIEPPMQKAGEVSPAINSGAERSAIDGRYFKLDRISIEKGSLSLKNAQPCCCQRKERFSQTVGLNHQESQLLRRRRMGPMMIPAIGKPIGLIGCNSNPRPTNFLGVSPEVVPPSSCPIFGSTEKVVPPVIKPPAGPIPFKDSSNTGVRLSVRADCDSASPSGSNPILRLMGKNLMVVNKDEDASAAADRVQPGSQNNHQISEFPTFSAVSPGNNQGQESRSFHHMVPQCSIVYGLDQRNPVRSCFEVGLSNSFGSHSDGKLRQGDAQLTAGMLRNQCVDHGFSASVGPHEFKGDCSFSSRQNMLKSRLNMSPVYDSEKTTTTPDHQCKPGASSTHPIKEIIIIDDVPENVDACLISDTSNYPEVWRESQVVSSGISNSTVAVNSPGCTRPFCYQTQDQFPPYGESLAVFPAGYHATPGSLANTGPVRWGCTSEGSTVMVPRNPFTAAPSSSSHVRSTALYYSPGFS